MKFKHGDMVEVEGYLGEVIKVTESYIKEVAEKWKDQIDHCVYEALISYEVEECD